MAEIRVVESQILRLETEVDEETGQVDVVAYNRAGIEVARQVAFEVDPVVEALEHYAAVRKDVGL